MNSRFSKEILFEKLKNYYRNHSIYKSYNIEEDLPDYFLMAAESGDFKLQLEQCLKGKNRDREEHFHSSRNGILIKCHHSNKIKISAFYTHFRENKHGYKYIKNDAKNKIINLDTARTLLFSNNFIQYLSPKNWDMHQIPNFIKTLHKNNEWAENFFPCIIKSYKNISLKQFENCTNARMFLSIIHPLFPRLLQLKSSIIFNLIDFFEMLFPMQQLTPSIIDFYINVTKETKQELKEDIFHDSLSTILNLIKTYLLDTNKSKEKVDSYIIRDYFNLCKQLNIMPVITSYKKLKEDHDKYSKEILYKKMPEITADKKFNVLKETNEVQINYIDTKDKLIEEAAYMKHCVGSYAHSINNGNCGIYGIIYGGERYTLELVSRSKLFTFVLDMNENQYTRKDEENIYIRQLKGRFNKEAPKELQNLIQKQIDIINSTPKRLT